MKKKICIVCASPLTLHLFFRAHISKLSKYFDVTVICSLTEDSYVNIDDLDINIIKIPFRRKTNIWLDILSLFYLSYYFINYRFDLLWAVAPKAGFIATLAGFLFRIPKRLFVFQGEVWSTKIGFERAFLKMLDKIIFFTSTCVLAVGEGERRFLIAEKIATYSQISVLGFGSICGVDIQKYDVKSDQRMAIRNSFYFPENSLVIVFIGRVTRDKGILDLVEAFIDAKTDGADKLCLLIVGPDEEHLVSIIRQLTERFSLFVKYIPFTPEPWLYFAACDIFCLPSYREGFPITILEAAASGITTIGADIYGINDAIDNGKTGVLFKPKDKKALKEILIDFHERPNVYKALGEEAKINAKRLYSTDEVVSRYTNLILKLTNTEN